ncbi:MAG: hypothetical protein AAF393_14890 [Pseudomonadota bacterium]
MSKDHGHVLDLGGVPSWYRDIYPAGDHDGFYQKLGTHAAAFVERRDTQLVVSFDNLSDAGHPGYDKEAWAGAFCRYNSWSHLGIFTQEPSWFRSAQLVQFLEKLKADGFFERFANVTFCGTSMGAFASLAFCGLAPGCNVIAFSPQTTLIRDRVPWEDRFKKADLCDWTLPYSDAAETVDAAGKVYLIYDPFHVNDTKQVMRLKGDNLIHLRGPGLGHRTALALSRLGTLKPVIGEGIFGTLSRTSFSELIRSRGRLLMYRENMLRYLEERDVTHRQAALEEAFRNRRAAGGR